MSSIKLKKPHEFRGVKHRAGETISVPFATGRELIAFGIGHYADAPQAVEVEAPSVVEAPPRAVERVVQPAPKAKEQPAPKESAPAPKV